MIHCDFKAMLMPCTLTREAYRPAQAVLQGQSVVMSLLLARARRGATLQRPEDCALRALYEHRVMCFRYREKNLKTLALLGFTKETET